MISSNDLKPGLTILVDGEIYTVLEASQNNVNISSYEGEILGVILPDKATLKVVECEQAVKGDTATSASKNAVLETGLEVKVPLFINQDEMIVVNTNDGKYSGRAK